jgi:hypothetical protein
MGYSGGREGGKLTTTGTTDYSRIALHYFLDAGFLTFLLLALRCPFTTFFCFF